MPKFSSLPQVTTSAATVRKGRFENDQNMRERHACVSIFEYDI